jgi:hypothetical protein
MNKSTFKSERIAGLLAELGWAVVDLCTENELKKLQSVFQEYLPELIHMPVIVSLLHKDRNITKQINNTIIEILTPHINSHLQYYKIPIALFFAKHPKTDVQVGPHQDPMITDQATYPSYGIWLPLIETNIYNGTLSVLSKSHRWFHPFQSDTIPASIGNIGEELVTDCICFSLKPGQAIIMDNRLVHYSYPNNSEEIRPAVVVKFTHYDADYFTLYSQNNKTNLIKNNDHFYTDEAWIHDKSRFPEGEILGVLDFTPYKVTQSEYKNIAKNNLQCSYQTKSITSFLKTA